MIDQHKDKGNHGHSNHIDGERSLERFDSSGSRISHGVSGEGIAHHPRELVVKLLGTSREYTQRCAD